MSQPTYVTLSEIQSAAARISGAAIRTPLTQLPGTSIWIKAESAQPIGSFKLRGAYNTIAQLTPEQLRLGVITYSSGNHAQGVAFAARALNSKAVIVMPDNAPQVKIDATRALGAEVVFVGPASSARKLKAEELSAAHGYTIIPPYDHPHIIAGQATCALEILQELPDVDLILSPVSGGGLLSGTATCVKQAAAAGLAKPTVQVWGCEPELAADAKESFDTKTLVEWPAALTTRTIGDGLRTQSLGQLNFHHILKFVDGIVTVTEDEIYAAMRRLLKDTDLVPEPSGAVTLAAALFHAHQLPAAAKTAVILSGGNIDPKLLESLK
ncbi:threonine ammonia-lyase [Granulicella tundricola]|uniref:Pyridoxal-5'-phosphate-dependent protein beta subunit n=1 Tax=Granulicella tundricola (strain ATCC BAA-1859 / DSM 23138 / MP5ACTX9) TaxID=1198114 RepID=E8WZP6_GRATM|nr:threonine/serine dehydratase [Granulicella tundricola]ADW70020.1 Pyridoxal-5'-phosphate-dependent protein beta subunit [Granulicella tundricola MP5ACTX9]